MPLGDIGEALVQLIDARSDGGHARRISACGQRRAHARLAHQDGALLRLLQRGLEFLDRTTLIPQPGFETLRQAPVHDALHEPVSSPHIGQIRIVRVGREVVLDILQARPGCLLLRRAQGSDIVGLFDLVDARFEIHAFLGQPIQIGRRQYGIGLGHASAVGFLARIQHVVVG